MNSNTVTIISVVIGFGGFMLSAAVYPYLGLPPIYLYAGLFGLMSAMLMPK